MKISLNFTIERSDKQVAPLGQFSSFHFAMCYKQVTPLAYFIFIHHYIKQVCCYKAMLVPCMLKKITRLICYPKNECDPIEALIYEEGLRIIAIDFHPDQDIMLIILNTKAVLHQKISSYKCLSKADSKSLSRYELISNGVGVHWPLLDEDLSLKGFLKDE